MASREKEYRTYGALLMFIAAAMLVAFITRVDSGVQIIIQLLTVLLNGSIGWKLYKKNR